MREQDDSVSVLMKSGKELIMTNRIFNTGAAILLLLFSLASVHVFASEEVYFDRYGHCERTETFDLADEEYMLRPVGGGFSHENLLCDMTFKSPPDYGICLTFHELEITDCSVRVKIYSTSSSSGSAWRVLECADAKPAKMCTPNRFVTVEVVKSKLNGNLGYSFKINVEKSNSISEEGVLFASIGVFVGVILGVVALIAALAVVVIYCCCKHKSPGKKKVTEIGSAMSHESRNLVQPSAPPVDIEDNQWDLEGNLYPHLPHDPYPPAHPPPPYVPPPPYQEDEHLHVDDHIETHPQKL